MKSLIRLSALMTFAGSAFAAPPAFCTGTPQICQQVVPLKGFQIRGEAVPASLLTLATADVYLEGFTVSNPTSGAITFSLCDRQGTPICPIPAVSIAANQAYIINWPDGRLYWASGGFTIIASGVGLTIQGGWKQ